VRRKSWIVIPLSALLLLPVMASAQRRAAPPSAIPTRVGTCAFTHIRQVTQRLEDGVTHRVLPGSGSAVKLANGLYQVSYDQVPAVNRSRRGDPAWTCLMRLPQHCPPGDNRGKLYTTTNMRTISSWTLPDSEHSCGGA
jgi:hypothetical protein